MSREYLKSGLSKSAGIYRVINSINGKFYIGSSKNLAKRWWEHRKFLRLGTHVNSHLQNSWNLYGELAFKFEVLQEEPSAISRLELQSLEQAYLDLYIGKEECFNLNLSASCPDSGNNKVEIVQKGKDGNLVRKWPSIVEAGLALGIDETGIMNCCRGRLGSVREWCFGRGLSYKAFHQLVRGKIKSSGGWSLAIQNIAPDPPLQA